MEYIELIILMVLVVLYLHYLLMLAFILKRTYSNAWYALVPVLKYKELMSMVDIPWGWAWFAIFPPFCFAYFITFGTWMLYRYYRWSGKNVAASLLLCLVPTIGVTYLAIGNYELESENVTW